MILGSTGKRCGYLIEPGVFERMLALDAEGLHYGEIAERTGLSYQVVQLTLSAATQDVPTSPPEPGEHDPTPEELRRRCLAIQREWSPRERAKRAGSTLQGVTGWSPPEATLHVGPGWKEDAA